VLCLKLAAFTISFELLSRPAQRCAPMPISLHIVLLKPEKAYDRNGFNPLHRYAGVDAVMYVCQYYPQGNVALPEYFIANVMPLI
jgi:hypothetical protein